MLKSFLVVPISSQNNTGNSRNKRNALNVISSLFPIGVGINESMVQKYYLLNKETNLQSLISFETSSASKTLQFIATYTQESMLSNFANAYQILNQASEGVNQVIGIILHVSITFLL